MVGDKKERALLLQVVERDVIRCISRRDVEGGNGLLLQLLLHMDVLKVVVRVRSLIECSVVAHQLLIVLCCFEAVQRSLALRRFSPFVILYQGQVSRILI